MAHTPKAALLKDKSLHFSVLSLSVGGVNGAVLCGVREKKNIRRKGLHAAV